MLLKSLEYLPWRIKAIPRQLLFLSPRYLVERHTMYTSTFSLAIVLVAAALAEPSMAIPSSLVRVTETDIPDEALIGLAVSTNANDDGHRSMIEPYSSEACVENRLCGPGHICCEGVCMVCHFC